MKTINSLPTLRTHSPALQAELAEVLAKYGLKLTRKAGTVYPDTGKIKITIETTFLSSEGEEEVSRKLWEKYAPAYGIPADAFGKVLWVAGEQFKLVGLNLNSRKSPVKLIRQHDQKAFTCSTDAVVRALGIPAQS